MENVFQLVLTLAGVVVAITLVVAVSHLSAIRNTLEMLVKQGRMPVPQTGREQTSEQAAPVEEAPEEELLTYRPEAFSPPPPAPVEQARFEAPEQTLPASRPAVLSPPPPPPVAVEQTRFAEAPEQMPLPEQAPDQAPPTYRPAEVSPPPLIPTEPKASRLPVVIGIVVLVSAIGFLAFLVLYTK